MRLQRSLLLVVVARIAFASQLAAAQPAPNPSLGKSPAGRASRDPDAEQARSAVPPELLRYARDRTDLSAAAAAQDRFQRAEAELQRRRQNATPESVEEAAAQVAREAEDLYAKLTPPPDSASRIPSLAAARALYDQAGRTLEVIRSTHRAYSAAPGGPDAPTLLARLADRAAELQRLAQDFTGRLAAVGDDIERLASPNKALVVSGGVSLGSHQAGFLYYYGLYLKHIAQVMGQPGSANLGRFRVATGASAGSINAFLALVEGCREPQYDPEQSLFFRSWIDVGFDKLFKPERVTHDSFLAPDALDEAVAALGHLLTTPDQQSNRWMSMPCVGYLGVSATRMRPRPLVASDTDEERNRAPRVALQRQTEKFLIRIATNGAQPPVLTSHRLSTSPSRFLQELYPTLGMWTSPERPEDQRVDPRDLLDLLRASAAFPGAFPPVPVPVTIWTRQNGEYLGRPEKPLFIDGGILDNTPFRLARRLVGSLPNSSGDASFLFLKSDAVLWRREPAHRTPPPDGKIAKSIFAEYLPFLADFINDASDNELIQSLEDNPRRELPGRGAPVAGEHLAHFFAFVERDFRRFDFYQGMVDAFQHVKNHPLIPDVANETREVPIQSATFECFLAYRKALNTVVPQNAPPDLPASCRRDQVDDNMAALLRASAAVRSWDWRGRPSDEGRDDLEVFATALAKQNFKYREFANGRTLDANGLKDAFRGKIQLGARTLLAEQEGLAATLGASVLGKSLSNYYWYRTPSFGSVGIANGLEFSAGLVLTRGQRLSLKLVPTVRWVDPSTARRSFDPPVAIRAVTPMVDLEAASDLRAELTWGPSFQLELGVGYHVRSHWRAVGPLEVFPREAISFRHGPMGTASVVLFQHLYVTAWLSRWVNGPCDTNAECQAVRADFRDFVEPLEPRAWGKRLSLGWRFLY